MDILSVQSGASSSWVSLGSFSFPFPGGVRESPLFSGTSCRTLTLNPSSERELATFLTSRLSWRRNQPNFTHDSTNHIPFDILSHFCQHWVEERVRAEQNS